MAGSTGLFPRTCRHIHHLPHYRTLDASKRDQAVHLFATEKIDAVIDLAGLPELEAIPDESDVDRMIACYFKIPYTLLSVMEKFGANKFVLASSNHVTGHYETNGHRSLGREITNGLETLRRLFLFSP